MRARYDPVKDRSGFQHGRGFPLSVWEALNSGQLAFIILTLSLTIRLVVLGFLAGEPIADDAVDYQANGLNIASDGRIPLYWPPGLPYYLAFFYRIFGFSELLSRWSVLPTFLLLAVGTWLLAREISGLRAANLAILLLSFYPTFIHLSVEPLTQMPTAALLTLAALASLKLLRGYSWKWSLLLGPVLGALTLTRPSSILLAILIPLILFLKTRRPLRAILPAVLATILIGGWLVEVREQTGSFVWINYANSKNVYLGNNVHTPLYRTWWFGSHHGEESGSPEFNEQSRAIGSRPPHEQDRLYKAAALDHIISRPDIFLLRSLNRFRCFFAFDTLTGSYFMKWYSASRFVGLSLILIDAMFYSVVLILALTGTRLLWQVGGVRDAILTLLGIVLLYSTPYWLSFAHPTYHFPTLPLLTIIAATGVTHLIDELKEPVTFLWTHKLFLGLGLLMFALIQVEWIWMMRGCL